MLTEMRYFDSEIQGKKEVLVVFYADWCGFCARFCPEFKDVGRGCKTECVMVDISNEDDPVWEKYRIEVVPTIMLFRNGSVVGRKSGPMERSDLEKFMRKYRLG